MQSSLYRKEWGVDRNLNGYVNKYEIECDGLTIFDLNSMEYCILHWMAVLLENREFDMPSALAAEAREKQPDGNILM